MFGHAMETVIVLSCTKFDYAVLCYIVLHDIMVFLVIYYVHTSHNIGMNTCTCIHIFVHTYIHRRMYACMRTFMDACMHTHTHTHKHTQHSTSTPKHTYANVIIHTRQRYAATAAAPP